MAGDGSHIGHKDNDSKPQGRDFERARATPLRPVVWMTSVLAWAAVVALVARVPNWASVFLCTLTGLSFLVFLVGYIYLFTNDRDALRAERWRLGTRGALPRGSSYSQEALDADRQVYLGPERAELSVTPAAERESKAPR
jgi:hypothetical protein